MKTINVVISTCMDCPYMHELGDFYTCNINKHVLADSREEDPFDIPDFCPLPDLEDNDWSFNFNE